MQDIGAALEKMSKEKQCSAFTALLILLNSQEKGDNKDVCTVQPKSQQETSR